MDRYERMRSGNWPRDTAASNFRRMPEHATSNRWGWIEDAASIALAVTVLVLLAAFVR